MALTDVEVEADALVQFLLFRIEAQDRFEQRDGTAVVVTLQGLEPRSYRATASK